MAALKRFYVSYTGYNFVYIQTNMSFLMFTGALHKLTHLIIFILVCVGYINLSIISHTISLFLKLSNITGQFLVNKFLFFCGFTLEIVTLTYSFLKIVYEDALVFIKDATEKFVYAVWFLKECILLLEKGVDFCHLLLCSIYDVVCIGVISVSQLGSAAFGVFVSTIQVLHLTGLTIWIFLTSVPQKIIDCISTVNNFTSNAKNDLERFLINFTTIVIQKVHCFYMSIFDIPLDSIYGLIVGGIFMTILCIKFKDICFMICSAILKFYKCVVSFGITLWTGRFLEPKNENIVCVPEDDERLCVVCQYHVKEIIILPCKHLCLCWECSDRIIKNHQTCPVCRTHIREALKVYM